MIDQQRQRVEQEMTKMVDDMDKSFLRKMQVNNIYIGYVIFFFLAKKMLVTLLNLNFLIKKIVKGYNASMCRQML